MSTISSADGQYERKKLKEQWGKSRERVILSMIFAFAQHEIRISTFFAHSPFYSLSLPVRANAKSIGENRSLARLPPLLFQRISVIYIRLDNVNPFVIMRIAITVPLKKTLESFENKRLSKKF